MKKLYVPIIFLACFLQLSFGSFAQAPNTWTKKANFGGSLSQFSVGFNIGSKGYIGTGQIGSDYYSNVFWEYDLSTDSWTQKANFGGAARNYAVGFSIGNKGYLGTGSTISGSASDFWEYDPSANTWTQKANFGGSARTGAVGFSINTKGYIGTGSTVSGYASDFWEYDPSSNTWTQKANFGGTSRQGATGFSIGAKGYIGTGWDGTLKNDFWEYNPSTNTWTVKASFSGTGREGAAGFNIGAKGYIGTGWDGDLKNDFWEYNPSTNSWTLKAVFGGTGRDFASSFSIGTYGFIGTGEQYGGPSNDFWEYTPSCILPSSPVNTTPVANLTICGGYTTALSASGTGTLGWYSAAVGGSWMGSGTNFTTPVLNVSTTFYVQDSTCGASASRTSIPVTVNPAPAANAGANRAICLNSTTQIGSAPVTGNTYNWTSVPAGYTSTLANPTVTPLVTTTYTLTETITATGCSKTNSVGVTVNTLPAAVAGANRTICQNTGTQIGAAPATGHTYSWTSVPAGYTSTLANPVVTPLVTTTYTLVETITATGCTNTNSVVVTVNSSPAANAGTNKAICPGESTQIGSVPVSGNTYSWTSVPAGFTSTLSNPTVTPLVTTTYTLTETITATGCTNSNSVVVTVNPLPAANAGANRAICLNSNTQLGAAPVSGNTYSWTSIPAGFTSTLANPTVSPLINTTYTLTEINTATGCTNTNSVVITVNLLPAAVAGANRTICQNTSTQIGSVPVAGNTYSWTSVPTGYTSTLANPTVTPLVTTTYTLVETITATGCTNTNSVVVTVNPAPAANAGANRAICLNASTQIGADPVAGNTYSWTSVPAGFTSSLANPAVTPLVTTTYTLTESNTTTGCTNTNNVVVTVNPLPAAVAGLNRVICLNTSTQIGASPAAGHTYSWTSVPAGFTSTSSNPIVSPLVTTTYTLTETITATGCTNSNSVMVTVNPSPAANAGANRSLCLNESTQIGSAPITGNTYSWTSVPAGFTSTLSNPIVIPLVTTSYTLTETITATGCTNINSVIVTVNPLPAAATGANRTICLNTSTQLGASPSAGHTYSWTSVPSGFTSTLSNPTVTPLVATTYTLVETISATGCTNSNSVVVTVNPSPSANAGANRAVCMNESTLIGSTPIAGNTYSWTSVPAGYTSTLANPAVTPLVTTTYILTETITATGCTNSNTVTVTVYPLPAAVAGANRSVCLNAGTQLGAAPVTGNTYSWTSVPAGFTSTLANPIVSPIISTTYTLTETITATGCTKSNSVIVTVNPLPAAAVGDNRIICQNTSTQIGAAPVPGSTYTWTSVPAGFTSVSANPTVTPLVTTTYTLTETVTATGCTSTNSVMVAVNPAPSANAGANRAICLNESTQIGSAPITGNTYSWTSVPAGFTSSLANPTVAPLITTTYTLTETITATGCTNSNNIMVTVNPLPAAVAGINRFLCLYASTQIGAAPAAGHTYSWTSAPTGFTSTSANPIVTPLVTTTYNLTETITATGCTNSNSVVVTINPAPAANAGANRAICLNESTQIGSAPITGNTYSWTSVPAGFTSTLANPVVNPLLTTTYTLTETITATGCTNSGNVVVTVNPLPAAVAGANRAICLNTGTQIGSAPITGNTYSWSSVPTGFTSTSANPTVSPLLTTTYTLTVTVTSTGCTNSNSVVVSVNPLPAAVAGLNRTVCQNTSTQIGADPVAGNTYSWTSVPAGFTSTLSNPTVSPLVTTTYTLTETITATGCINTNSVVVTLNPLPAAVAGANRAICLNSTTQIGSAPVIGNTYSWTSIPAGFTSISANPTVTPLVTTTYTLTETVTATGCSKTNSVVVTVNPLPAAVAGLNRSVCQSTSTQLGSVPIPGNTYSWTSVPAGFTSTLANPVVTPLVTTTYTLVETITGTGCTNSNNVVVTVNPTPPANAGANTAICLNGSAQIGSAPITGNTYSWTSVPAGFTSASANPTVTPLITTTYTLTETITATGCTNSNSVVITVNTLPAAVAGLNRSVCLNASTQIGAAPATGHTYSWTSIPPGFASTLANPVVAPLITTTYLLTETITATGCTNSNSVVVTVNPSPAANAGSNKAICLNESTQIGSAPVAGNTYSWTSVPAGFTSTSSNPTVAPLLTTTYFLTETITATGCANTNSVVVTVNPLPAAAAGVNRSVCLNAGTQIGSAPITGHTYIWTSVPAGFTSTLANPVVTPLVNTTYTLTETNTISGCTNSNSVVVTVNPLPAAVAGANRVICLNASTQIGSDPVTGHTYSWSSVPAGFTSTLANPVVTSLVTTTYTLTETITASGCTNSNSVVITVNPLPVPVINGLTSVCVGATGVIYSTQTGMGSYQWNISSGGTILSGLGTDSIQVRWDTAGARFVSVNYINSFGCMATNPVVKNITVNPLPVPAITGSNNICINATGAYATESGMSSYLWVVSPGGSLVSGSGTNTIHVSWTAAGARTVSVNYLNQNNCTAASPTVFNVTVNPLPAADAGANRALCLNQSTQIGAAPVPGSTYSWTSVPAGFTSTLASPVVTPLVTTTYFLTETTTFTGCTNTNSVVVTVNPLPSPSISGLSAVCAGVTGVIYSTQAGMSNYQWNISQGGTILSGLGTASIQVRWDTAGARFVSVNYSNSFGCFALTPAVKNVTVYPLPVPAITGPGNICLNATATYSTESGMSNYLWTVSAGGNIASGSGTNAIQVSWNSAGSGTVSVSYRNANSCTAASPTVLNVTVNPLPAAAAGSNRVICQHDSTQIGSSPVTGNTYSWTSVPAGFTSTLANPMVAPLLTTTYTLTETITATGCTNSHTVIVTVNPSPSAATGPNKSVCLNASTQIGAVPVAGNTYSWTSSPAGFTSTSANPIVTPLLTTIYTLVETTTATGCSNTNSVVITVNPLPAAVAGNNRAICLHDSTQLGSAPIPGSVYTWSSVPAGFSSTLANPKVSPLITTIYTLTETISSTGCTNTNSLVVTVNPLPSPSITGPSATCMGIAGNIFYTQVGMTNYQWNVSQGVTILSGLGTASVQVRFDSAGTRFVTVNYSNSFGCMAQSPAVKYVTVHPLPVPTITGSVNLCMNATGTYTTESGMSGYLWTVSPGGSIVSGSGTNTIHVAWNAAGAQDVSVNYLNQNSCTAASPTVLNVNINPLPAAAAGANRSICLHDSTQIGSVPVPGSTYNWTSVPAGFTSTLANPFVAPVVTTTYTLTESVTATGCTNTNSMVVTVHPLPSPTISGPTATCAGVSGVIYSTQTGMGNYQWNISSGGTIQSGLGTASVQVRWDSAGARFISVNYSNSSGCSALTPVVKNVTVYSIPVPTITGPDSLCMNATGTYTTESGMGNYQWVISPGGSSVTGLGTNTIHVTWTTSGPRYVTVNYQNANNCSAASPTVYNVTVFALPVPVITGSNTVCANASGVVYATQSGMSNYVWGISANGTITSGQGTDSIAVTWGNTGSGTVSVTYTSVMGCNPVNPSIKTITIIPRPVPTISGSTTVCVNAGPKTYFTEGGQQNYTWNISSGDSILGGQGTSQVSVQWSSAGSRWISVNYSSPAGCQAVTPDTLHVTVSPVPDAASAITGPALLCVPAFWQEYSIDSIANAGGYFWTLPAGAIFQGTSNSNVIHVAYLQNAQSGNITVYGTNVCGNGPASSLFVTLHPIPQKPVITLEQNDTLVSNSTYGNQWYFNNQLLPGDTLNHLHATLTGNYYTIVTLGNCSSDTSNILFVIAVGMKENPGFNVSIHPNPTSGRLVIDFVSPGDKLYKVILVNELGALIQESERMITKGKYSWIIDLGNLSPGPVFLMIQSPEGIIRKKIIKN